MRKLSAVSIVAFLICVLLVAYATGKTQISNCPRCNCTNDNLPIGQNEYATIDENSIVDLGKGYGLEYSAYEGNSGPFVFSLLKDEQTDCIIKLDEYISNESCYCDKNGKPLIYIYFDIFNRSGSNPFSIQWNWL
ncbi:MAG: hypothetical protein PHQ34_13010 [Methanothrix sp.]|nr:hypothetical protein [Methanothrix sp.]